jgi:hypothetical protein
MKSESPLSGLIASETLKPYRITFQRPEYAARRAGEAQGPTGDARPDGGIVFATSPTEAWSQFNESRRSTLSLKASGATIEELPDVPAAA